MSCYNQVEAIFHLGHAIRVKVRIKVKVKVRVRVKAVVAEVSQLGVVTYFISLRYIHVVADF